VLFDPVPPKPRLQLNKLRSLMADTVSKKNRSRIMASIRGANTKPELLVRSLLHRQGYRFTVNGPLNRCLPGRPDIVLPKYHTAIFVHGCFWHCHKGCASSHIPKSNRGYWRVKLGRNVKRDKLNISRLKGGGWRVVVIWECKVNAGLHDRYIFSRLPG